jgi:hypothetical protein
MPLATGTKLGAYEIRAPIGAGGMVTLRPKWPCPSMSEQLIPWNVRNWKWRTCSAATENLIFNSMARRYQ